MRRQQPERAEQRNIIALARSLGAGVYVLGTTRRHGDYQGTMQTAGIPDLWIFLPRAHCNHAPPVPSRGLWWETKAPHGRRSLDQVAFGEQCTEAEVEYGSGPLDAFIEFLSARGYLEVRQLPHYKQPKGAL